jgi:D-xylose transport system substrate-binding protein
MTRRTIPASAPGRTRETRPQADDDSARVSEHSTKFFTRSKEQRMRVGWITSSAVALAAISVVLAACGGDSNGGAASKGSSSHTIGLLLPESKTPRYESQDKPQFEQKVKSLCSDCSIFYANANQDADTQQQQAEAALTRGVDVLVLDPVDTASAASIVAMAKQQNVPVISYDRLVTNADVDYYVSFDNVRVGRLQAQSLVKKLDSEGESNGTIVMVNGAPTDSNAAQFKQGANSVLSKSSLKIGKEYDTPDWSPDEAQTEMQQAITALGNSGFVGAYVANDGMAGGVIAAMKGAGINPSTRPTTGQDADLAGIQRILVGQQYMTVYKAIKTEAQKAAQIAVAVAEGEPVPSGLVNRQVGNGATKVPSVILTPVAVTKANVESTVVKDGFWTAAQICTSKYRAACHAAGIK